MGAMVNSIDEIVGRSIRHARRMFQEGHYDWPTTSRALSTILADLEARFPTIRVSRLRACLNRRLFMPFGSAAAMRTAVFVIALSGAGLWALHAMDARADQPQSESAPCAEARALFAAKLAYLEARISPEPRQEEAWQNFANAMRASAGELDRACAEEPVLPQSVDAGERLQQMEKHAAAVQAMFGAMAKAYLAIARQLTTAQRDILSRNIVPSPPILCSFPRRRPADSGSSLAPGTWHGTAAQAGRNGPTGGGAVGAAAVLIPEFPSLLVEMRESAVTTSVFGSEVRRRTAMFGGLALLTIGVFMVGAILARGRASSEFGPCAIRFNSLTGCRSPS